MKTNIILFMLLFFLIFLFVKLTLSLPSSFTTPKTCSQTWGGNCGSTTLNDAFNNSWNGTDELGCNGTQSIGSSDFDVEEVYINVTSILFGSESYINATCQFYGGSDAGSYDTRQYMFYFNGSNWIELGFWIDNSDPASVKNRSIIFKPNNTVGTHWIRCSSRFKQNITHYCAMYDGLPDGGVRDNDDVNFTVTDYPKYTFWNLTNYTTGATIQDGSHLTRKDTINASAQWDKQLSLKHFNELHHFLLRVGRIAIDSYTLGLSLLASSFLQQPFSPSVFL